MCCRLKVLRMSHKARLQHRGRRACWTRASERLVSGPRGWPASTPSTGNQWSGGRGRQGTGPGKGLAVVSTNSRLRVPLGQQFSTSVLCKVYRSTTGVWSTALKNSSGSAALFLEQSSLAKNCVSPILCQQLPWKQSSRILRVSGSQKRHSKKQGPWRSR